MIVALNNAGQAGEVFSAAAGKVQEIVVKTARGAIKLPAAPLVGPVANEGAIDPAFPLAHRTDLPEEERQLSARTLASIERGADELRRGLAVPLDPALLADD